MAYIRCLSNPESLYVWDQTDGNTIFSLHGCDDDPRISVPSKEVEAFFRELYKWEKRNSFPFFYGSISVEETKEYKIKLILGSSHLVLWEATWNLLRDSFYSHVIGSPGWRSVRTFGS